MRKFFAFIVLTLVMYGAHATPVAGVQYASSGNCLISYATSGILSGAVNSSSLDSTSCSQFITYQVTTSSGSKFYLAECNTCKSGYYKSGYAGSDTGGSTGGTAIAIGDYSSYTISECGNIAYLAKCSKPTTCTSTKADLKKTSISNCTSEGISVFGSQVVNYCKTCATGYQLSAKSVSRSSTACTNTTTENLRTACTERPKCTYDSCEKYTTEWKCGGWNGSVTDTNNPNGCWRRKFSCTSDGYTCADGYENKCRDGYYYEKVNIMFGRCTKCPNNPDDDAEANAVYNGLSLEGIESCFVTKGTDYTGTYEFENSSTDDKCYYSES
mgnify:CR=1 FL=1